MTNHKRSDRLPVPRYAAPEVPAMQDWAEALVAQARSEGVSLTGEGGLLTAMIRQVLQTGLEVEMTEHLGFESRDPASRGAANVRNGRYPKTVATEIGDVEVLMPRDRAGSFEPVTIPKHARRLDGLAGNVISLSSTAGRGTRRRRPRRCRPTSSRRRGRATSRRTSASPAVASPTGRVCSSPRPAHEQ